MQGMKERLPHGLQLLPYTLMPFNIIKKKMYMRIIRIKGHGYLRGRCEMTTKIDRKEPNAGEITAPVPIHILSLSLVEANTFLFLTQEACHEGMFKSC